MSYKLTFLVNWITLWAIIWHWYIVWYLVGPYCNECHDDFSLAVKLRRHIRSGPPKPAPATCYFVCLIAYLVPDDLDTLTRKEADLEAPLAPPPDGFLGPRHVDYGDHVPHLRMSSNVSLTGLSVYLIFLFPITIYFHFLSAQFTKLSEHLIFNLINLLQISS